MSGTVRVFKPGATCTRRSSAAWSRTTAVFCAHPPALDIRPRRLASLTARCERKRDSPTLTRTAETAAGPGGKLGGGARCSWSTTGLRGSTSLRRGRAVIFTGGRLVELPRVRNGWRWDPLAVDAPEIDAARTKLQGLMRDAEWATRNGSPKLAG